MNAFVYVRDCKGTVTMVTCNKSIALRMIMFENEQMQEQRHNISAPSAGYITVTLLGNRYNCISEKERENEYM